MSNPKAAVSPTIYDIAATDKLVAELRAGAGLMKWGTIVTLSIGGAASLGASIGGYSTLVGLVVGLVAGVLLGGVAAAVLEWMAQLLLGQRDLILSAGERELET